MKSNKLARVDLLKISPKATVVAAVCPSTSTSSTTTTTAVARSPTPISIESLSDEENETEKEEICATADEKQKEEVIQPSHNVDMEAYLNTVSFLLFTDLNKVDNIFKLMDKLSYEDVQLLQKNIR